MNLPAMECQPTASVRAAGGRWYMKDKIHPKYELCKVVCACGNKFETRSTVSEIEVAICSACHPFYTGKHKFVDEAGRVDKFRRKFGDQITGSR